MYTNLFPRATNEQLVGKRNKDIHLNTYSRTAITQLGICKVRIEHNNKPKICDFFEVPGNGMSDIKTLDILTVNCNTVDAQGADRVDKCSTNTANWQVQGKRHTTNTLCRKLTDPINARQTQTTIQNLTIKICKL